jgi:hypothetical protein
MVVTRKKRRENTDVSIYLNNKPLEPVNNFKYPGIIIDRKLTFREHIVHTSRKCSTLIHTLAKSAKLSCGLKHSALNTTYKGAILPLMLYGAPVWIGLWKRNVTKPYIAEHNGSRILKLQKLIERPPLKTPAF